MSASKRMLGYTAYHPTSSIQCVRSSDILGISNLPTKGNVTVDVYPNHSVFCIRHGSSPRESTTLRLHVLVPSYSTRSQ